MQMTIVDKTTDIVYNFYLIEGIWNIQTYVNHTLTSLCTFGKIRFERVTPNEFYIVLYSMCSKDFCGTLWINDVKLVDLSL